MKFSAANTKLKKLYKLAQTTLKKWLGEKIGRATAKVYSFDILSGVDCPFAFLCKSQAEEQEDGSRRIKDGPDTKFRCFSASQEVLFTNTYKSRKRNHDAIHSLETSDDMADALCAALPKDARVIRIHVSGDMFSHKYFLAWCKVAEREKLLQQDKNHQGKMLVMKLSEPKDPIESEEQLLLFDLNIPENTGS